MKQNFQKLKVEKFQLERVNELNMRVDRVVEKMSEWEIIQNVKQKSKEIENIKGRLR